MTNLGSLAPWLDHLRLITPPTGVLLIGAGSGTGPWVQWLKQSALEAVTLVEADDAQFLGLQRIAETQPSWHVRKEVVAPQAGTVSFHVASIASESGLLEPERLRGLWPNIGFRQSQTRQAITIDHLLEETWTATNWLLLDCMPAVALLDAAGEALKSVEVIVARGLLGGAGAQHEDASLEGLRAQMEARGFRLLVAEAGRHPELGHALLVRDRQVEQRTHRQQLADAVARQDEISEELTQARASTEQLRIALAEAQAAKKLQDEAHARRIAEMSAAKEVADNLAAQRQNELSQLSEISEELTRARASTEQLQLALAEAQAAKKKQDEAHAKQITEMSAAKEVADNLAAQRQNELLQLKQSIEQAKIAQARATEENAARIQELTQAEAAAEKLAAEQRVQLEQLRQQVAQLQTAQVKAAEEAAARSQALALAQAAAEKSATDSQQALEQMKKTVADTGSAQSAAAKESALRIQQLSEAKNAAEKLAAERQAQTQALEMRLQQLRSPTGSADRRLQQLQIEQAKAEAQIALIKELFLQEPKA